MTTFFWLAFVLGSWALAWFVFIKPMLGQIHSTMGLSPTLASRLSGAKTVIVSFGVSLFAAVKGGLDVLGQNSDAVQQVKDQIPWSNLVSADAALKIVSLLMVVITFLHLYGKLEAAKSSPQA